MKRVFEKVKADKRIIIGYSTSLFFLLVTYLVTMFANYQVKKRTALVEHTYKLISGMEMLLSKLKDAETGVRGYALTRDLAFLEPYVNSQSMADSIFNEINILTQDNIVHQQRLTGLKKSIDRRFEILIASVNYFKNGAKDTAFKMVPLQMESKRVMDKIRLSVEIIQNDEKNMLAKRDIDLKSTFTRIDSITIISLVLTISLVVIGFVTYTRENKARKIALKNIEEYQQQLSNRIRELDAANSELKQMRTMEKFAASGRIARTIAHEVRNPLTNINLAANQLKVDVFKPDENALYLFEIIERNSQRINKLIADLLNSTKFTELRFTSKPVIEVIDESLAMAADRIELNQIKVEKKYVDDCMLNVDFDKIKIPFLNIIINAVEAMEPGKGVLKVETRKDGDKCIVTISDNGCGMDEVSLSKLFEPYFTSKPKGNGLGLTNTQNIILNHQGTIAVQSELGKGTAFTIRLVIA